MKTRFQTSTSTIENLVQEPFQSQYVRSHINYLFFSSELVWNTIKKNQTGELRATMASETVHWNIVDVKLSHEFANYSTSRKVYKVH